MWNTFVVANFEINTLDLMCFRTPFSAGRTLFLHVPEPLKQFRFSTLDFLSGTHKFLGPKKNHLANV